MYENIKIDWIDAVIVLDLDNINCLMKNTMAIIHTGTRTYGSIVQPTLVRASHLKPSDRSSMVCLSFPRAPKPTHLRQPCAS